MKIHLSQQGKTEAFLLSKRILTQKGFKIQIADEKRNLISASRPILRCSDLLFFNILFSETNEVVTMSLIVNIFSASLGTFIATRESELDFCKTFNELLQKKSAENPFRLSKEDYALAV